MEHVKIEHIKLLGPEPYYDFHVPMCENYWAGCIWHHNTGKSWAAKAIGSVLDLPIVRVKIGAVFGKYVGDSEKGIRDVLRILDAMAPCLAFFDEIEKAFAGASGGSSDGHGTTLRVFGEMLTWMQERTGEPVFLVGAANKIDGIPPEFTRVGRFDAVFFVDLPTWTERDEILRVHLRKAGVDSTSWQGTPWWNDLLKKTAGFVGAEIEGVLTDARINAHAAGEPLHASHVIASIVAAPPLAVTRKQDVDAIRKWALEHGLRRASDPEAEPAQQQPGPVTFGGGIGPRTRTKMAN